MSAFLIELLSRLEPDPLDTIQDVLIYQTQMMRNSSLGPYVPADFSPPEYIVLVNALFYASLGIMLLAAFIAMLIKSWVREFDRGLRAISIPEQRAKTREFRYLGMERWKLQEMVAMLPYLIQISLLLFAIGLVLFLFHISKPSFGITTAIFGVGVLYYALTTTISIFVTSSPFHSPLSRTFGKVYQRVHAYLCPGIDTFLSPKMDITPSVPLRRRIQIFLQKSRPYLEYDFVESINTTTIDEFQLSTSASALGRIHDSVPNSQHSELIQESVWRVAGSPALRMPPLFKLPSWILDRGNDKEYILSPTSVVALIAVFVRIRDARYKKRIVAMVDICRAANDSRGPWPQLVHAIFDLLPDNFLPNDHADFRRVVDDDAFLRNVLPDTPLSNAARISLLRNASDYRRSFSSFMLRSLVFCDAFFSIGPGVWRGGFFGGLICGLRYGVRSAAFGIGIGIGIIIGIGIVLPRAFYFGPFIFGRAPFVPPSLQYLYTHLCDTLEDASLEGPLRRDTRFRCAVRLLYFSLRDVFLGKPRLDDMTVQVRIRRAYLELQEPCHLINLLQTDQLQEEEYLWLLNTLSGLHCDALVLMGHHVSKICLAILLHQAPKWNQKSSPNIVLIEAVVTLTAIACSSNETYQMKTLTNSHQHPWLLQNLRNPDHISRVIENINHSCCKELTSLLFLIIYALVLRGSDTLATQYLSIITAKFDFLFCASALTAIAPVLGDGGFEAVGRLLLAPQTQFQTPEVDGSMSDFPHLGLSQQGLFNNYDLQLGASQFPDPKVFAILLLLSKHLGPRVERRRQVRQLGMDISPFYDHRVHNMFAALSLQNYQEGDAPYRHTNRESLLLASFLESREPAISSLALHHYMLTVLSYDDEPLRACYRSSPSCYLPGGVHAVFSPILPDHYLLKGWEILDVFVDGFEKLSVEWRQAFAEAFFTSSRRPLLSGNGQNSTPVTGLNEILTWEYFCKGEREPEFTDAEFSGLDWMAMAWSLHLSQQSGTIVTVSEQRGGHPPGVGEPPDSEEFVLRVLCRLLDAAPLHSIIPIIPKLREFVQWFDDPNLFEYQSTISAMVEGAAHRHQECKTFNKFEKFHCMWYL